MTASGAICSARTYTRQFGELKGQFGELRGYVGSEIGEIRGEIGKENRLFFFSIIASFVGGCLHRLRRLADRRLTATRILEGA